MVHTQLKALIVIVLFVLCITTFERVETIAVFLNDRDQHASVFNPITTFLGIRGASTAETDEESDAWDTGDAEAYFDSTADAFDDGTNTDSSGATYTSVNTPSPSVSRPVGGIVTGTASSNVATNAPVTLSEQSPVLVCLPGTVTPGEDALIFWACRDGAHVTTSDTLATQGAVIGSVRVRPGIDTAYDLVCENDSVEIPNTATSCDITVAQSALALIATPLSVSAGEATTLSWQSIDTQSCVVSSDMHSNFSRQGVRGDASTPAINQDTTFTLTCETITGIIEERSVVVSLQ